MRISDERQGDLFGVLALPPLPGKRLCSSRLSPVPLVTQAESESLTALAERITRADIDEFVPALSDDALVDAVVAGTRELKLRLAREARQPKHKRRPSSPLRRAGERIGAEWGRGNDEDEF